MLKKITEKSSLLGLIDYFRILKALIILFLLFVRMNYVPNQNEKVLKEKRSKFQFICCENNIEKSSTLFQNDSHSFVSFSKISPHSSVTLSHSIESITSSSVY